MNAEQIELLKTAARVIATARHGAQLVRSSDYSEFRRELAKCMLEKGGHMTEEECEAVMFVADTIFSDDPVTAEEAMSCVRIYTALSLCS